MGCAGCSSNGNVAGCNNHGDCKTGGCNKLNTFNWLADMTVSKSGTYPYLEVRFKNGRKDFFKNDKELALVTGDAVVVDVPNGHHIGYVSLQGELVRLQMKKKKVEEATLRSIYRQASVKDMETYRQVRDRESAMVYRTREIIQELKLEMKLTDVEFQADQTKATFFYSADERVDFRELIKRLAMEFKIRVEMRQISLRQEAGRIGGIGSCGRELCCSTWLSDFKSVSINAARYQNLSLNPNKLSGQCGRLKCCLNYELDTYQEALRDIPKVEVPLRTLQGNAHLQKTDIFRKILWFSFAEEQTWFPVTADRVRQILEMNKRQEVPKSLDDNEPEFVSASDRLNEDLDAMDRRFRQQKRGKKRK